jgi:dihydropteroate synthase
MNRQFPRIMGVVNVTPDSFSDGGQFSSHHEAVAHGLRLVAEGADILDVGGESTRPGSESVSVQEELSRVIPVIEGIRSVNPLVPISIDTTRSSVASAALASGATMVNDVSGGLADPEILDVAAQAHAPYILMHIQGTPRTMQDDPHYEDVVRDVSAYLQQRVEVARSRGVQHILVDPGIGFGKNVDHNLALLSELESFAGIGNELLLGISRKRFLGAVTGITDPAHRDVATAMTHALLIGKPVNVIRVHNVALHAQLRSLHTAMLR